MRDTEHIRTLGWLDDVQALHADEERVWWVGYEEARGVHTQTRAETQYTLGWYQRGGGASGSVPIPDGHTWMHVGFVETSGGLWLWIPKLGGKELSVFPLHPSGPLLAESRTLACSAFAATPVGDCVEFLAGDRQAWYRTRWDPSTDALSPPEPLAPHSVEWKRAGWQSLAGHRVGGVDVQIVTHSKDDEHPLGVFVQDGERRACLCPVRFMVHVGGYGSPEALWFFVPVRGWRPSLLIELRDGVTPDEVERWNTPERHAHWERELDARRTALTRRERFRHERELRTRAGRLHAVRYDLPDLDRIDLWLTRDLGPEPPTEDAFELAVLCPAGSRWAGKLLFDVADRLLAEGAYDAMRRDGTLLLQGFHVGNERRGVLLVLGGPPIEPYLDGHGRWVHIVCAVLLTPTEEARIAARPDLGLGWHRAADRPQLSDPGRTSWAAEALPPPGGD